MDRLIEAGLAAYGRGDVDDAIVAWEAALAIDPNDPRALGYVDYARQHYDNPAPAEIELSVPYGLHPEEEEYEVEISVSAAAMRDQPPVTTDTPTLRLPKEMTVKPADPAPASESIDEGWSIEEDTSSRARTIESPPLDALTVEIEAEEPETSDFEARTSEYVAPAGVPRTPTPGRLPLPPEAAPLPPVEIDAEFNREPTTGVGQRALGFVQPTARAKRSSRPERPELKVTFRENARPDSFGDFPGDPDGTSALELDHIPPRGASESELELELDRGGTEADLELDLGRGQGGGGADDGEAALELGPPIGTPIEVEVEVEVDPPPRVGRESQSDFTQASEGPTKELGIRATVAATHADRADTVADVALSRTSTAEARARILTEIDKTAPPNETKDQRTKRRVAALIALATSCARQGQVERAVVAIDAAFGEDPDSAAAHKQIQQNRDIIVGVFNEYLGDLDRRPQLAVPMEVVMRETIDSRAAFLLSRVDGTLTFEELLDVSGMPRLEAGRYLCQLIMRGLLRPD